MSLKVDQEGRGDTTDRPPTSRAVPLHEVTTRPLIASAVVDVEKNQVDQHAAMRNDAS